MARVRQRPNACAGRRIVRRLSQSTSLTKKKWPFAVSSRGFLDRHLTSHSGLNSNRCHFSLFFPVRANNEFARAFFITEGQRVRAYRAARHTQFSATGARTGVKVTLALATPLARPRLSSAMGIASGLAESQSHLSTGVDVVASSAYTREMDNAGHRLAFGIGGVPTIDPIYLTDTPSFVEKVRSRTRLSMTRSRLGSGRLEYFVLPPLFLNLKIAQHSFRSCSSRAPPNRDRPPADLFDP